MIRDAPYGSLILSIKNGDRYPERFDKFSNAFMIGDDYKTTWDGNDGQLWLIINDVWDDEDTDYPEKFYVDNVGYFTFKITVVKK